MSSLLASLALCAQAASTVPLPAPEPVTLALIVASNRGSRPGRPPLQFADDDGAKYHHVFSAVAGEAGVVLLTEFDRDTARLFPELVGKVGAPTREGVMVAGEALARRAARLRESGKAVRFYFVFAGHGDVEDGKGFIELVDGPLTADDLHALLTGVAASETHVILDSCNSFFVVNPRKPGGRRAATPRDAAESLARRLPDVGVFLSTAAQAEVFEWSELQSGVFSHAVRSGLLGAADTDGDGRVSYTELAAFVETATAEIKNPLYRPRLFARGPNGDGARSILERPRAARAALLVDEPGPVRLAVRDEDGLRWLDTHKEAGTSARAWFPPDRGGVLEVERLEAGAGGRLERAATYRLPPSGTVEGEPALLARLDPVPPGVSERGTGEIFRSLFTRPFGPRALAAFVADGGMERVGERPAEPPDGPGTGLLGMVAVGLRVGAAFPTVTSQNDLVFKPGNDLALALTVQGSGPLALEAELGYFRASTSQPWRSAAYWAGVLGPGYPSPGVVPATDVSLEAVPLLLGARLSHRTSWGVVPYLAASGGVASMSLEVRPRDFFRGAVERAHDWAWAAQAGAGVAVELPAGLSAGIDVRVFTLLSPVRVVSLDFDVAAIRASGTLSWGPATRPLR